MTKILRLPNGLTCLTDERPGTGKVSMQVHIKSGGMHEKPEENGLTYLMQESCNGGTKTRSRDQIAEEIESRGGSYSTSTSRTETAFEASALTRHAGATFAVLADLVRNPAFTAAEVQKAKAMVEDGLSQQEQSPGTMAAIKFGEAAYAGQSVGLNPMGTEEMLSSFTPKQVKQKYAEVMAHPENIVISFSGDITAAEAEKLAADFFGDLAPAAAPAVKPPMTFTGGDIRESNGNDQLNLQFGFPAPGQDSPDRLIFLLLEEALAGGMSTPLFQEIREKRSLVYSVAARYVPLATSGTFQVIAGSSRGKAGELMEVTFDLLGKIVREGFTDVELAQARERLIRSIKDVSETADGMATRNALQILAFGRLIPIEEMAAQLAQVTGDDIRRAAAALLTGGSYALSAVGPLDTLPAAQEIKGMMQKQVAGVTLPAASAKTSIKPQLAAAAKKNDDKTGELKISTLPNGLKVMTLERPGTLACGAWVGAGSDHETPELNGATHMNEHMMFKGTPSYGPGTIDRIVEGELGGALNAYTSNDRTVYYFYSLEPSALDKVIDICGEMVFKANLDEGEYAGKDGMPGERAVVIEEIRRANDNLSSRKWDLLNATAYPDQEHGRTVLGPEEGLLKITAKMLADYRDEFYAPNNVVFSAVGPVRHEDFVKLVEAKYGNLVPQNFPALPTPVYKGGTAWVEMDAAQLCNIALVAESVPTTHPDSPAYEVLSLILGEGESSRLSRELVINRELASDVAAGEMDYHNCGQLLVVSNVKAKNVKAFIGGVYGEIRKLADDLTEAELDKAKATLEMSMLSALETNSEACDVHGNNVLAYGRLVTPAEISERVQALTVDDIKRVAKQMLACNPTLAMVVPTGTDAKLLPTHEEVVAMRDGTCLPGKCKPKGPEAA